MEPDPCTRSAGTLYVSSTVRSNIVTWLHTNKLPCHPGISHLSSLDRRQFWWPSMNQDIMEFVATCARNKPGNQPFAVLLQPSSTLSHQWSHIAVDFVTGLPPSECNTINLTIINRFSEVAHFMPLPKVPLALETAQLLVQNVFKIQGITSDVVSNRG